jgi:Arc/MetJ-type ribon-helix-helix transcriptional regulator
MNIDLNREIEKLVNEEVQAGRFQSPQEFIDAAVKQFRMARELGESEAQKLATLRVELLRAEEQIERGECSTYDEHTLGEGVMNYDPVIRAIQSETTSSYYSFAKGTLRILSVLHGARDVEALLST